MPNDTVYAETCASIGLIFFARRMLELSPKSEYADVMERALYNTVLSGIALDGKSFFYVNPLEVFPKACHEDARKAHVKPVRQKWFGCACCPPNIARLISSLGTYAYTETDDTLFVHMYMESEIEKNISDKKALLKVESDMPWKSDICITVKAKDISLRLALRIPEWADGYEIENPSRFTSEEKEGYLYLTKEWSDEDEIRIHIPMQVRLYEANDNVREDFGKVAVMRGPLVYCLEEVDNGESLHLLSLDTRGNFRIEKKEIAGRVVDIIKCEGYKRDSSESKSLYRIFNTSDYEKRELTFVPYYVWGNRGENEMQVWVNTR